MVACAYDWSTRASTGVSDAAASDSGGSDAAPAPDAADAASGDALEQADTSNDGNVCASLLAQLAEWRAKAKECAGVLATCTDSVVDECGCRTAVVDHSSNASMEFTTLVTDYGDQKCPLPSSCPSSCPGLQTSVCSQSTMECTP